MLPRFVKKRVDKICLLALPEAWNYNTSMNPVDVGTREDCVKKSDSHSLWFCGPEFLLSDDLEVNSFLLHLWLCGE